MNNSYENKGSLREQGYMRSKKNKRAKGHSGFFIRFNICMTMAAAVIFLSHMDLDIANKISEKVKSAIAYETDTEGIKEKAAQLYESILGEKTESVFSDLDEDLQREFENKKAMEDDLKNR